MNDKVYKKQIEETRKKEARHKMAKNTGIKEQDVAIIAKKAFVPDSWDGLQILLKEIADKYLLALEAICHSEETRKLFNDKIIAEQEFYQREFLDNEAAKAVQSKLHELENKLVSYKKQLIDDETEKMAVLSEIIWENKKENQEMNNQEIARIMKYNKKRLKLKNEDIEKLVNGGKTLTLMSKEAAEAKSLEDLRARYKVIFQRETADPEEDAEKMKKIGKNALPHNRQAEK